MREYIYSLMTDKKNGLFESVIKAVLLIISWFYGIISALVKFVRTLKAQKPKCKVISVGNITLGGTGKTPTSCMIARKLKDQNKNVAVLIRGYGDDEWKMIKELLDPIPVVVGPDRLKNAGYAVKEFGADTAILDDGFQHWKIKRDLDIVLIDSSNPFGNGHIFPRGTLREGLSALKRADILILTKADMGRANLYKIRNRLRNLAPELPIAESIYKPTELVRLDNKESAGLAAIKGKVAASLSSIVNTKYFEFVLKGLGGRIGVSFHYPDHYRYRTKDLDYIIDVCRKHSINTIVTTEKDAVKLKAYSLQFKAINVLVLRIEPEITKGEEVLNRRLLSLYRG